MKWIELFLFIISCLSCAPVICFRTPEILEKDETLLGIGNSYFQYEENDVSFINPNVWIRNSISENTDLGIKLGRFDGFEIDYKFNLSDRYLYITGDISISYTGILYTNPMVLFGNKYLYAGYKYSIALIPTDEEWYNTYIIGLSYTFEKITLISEIIFWKETDANKIFNTFGLGVQFHFGKH